MHRKQNTIKIKVIGLFLLAALAVLLTGIISYNSYRELLESLENPSNQETKLKELGDILVDITQAEANMRAYALNRNDSLLDGYQNLVATINQDLETIKVIEPVSLPFNQKVDSISTLLNHQTAGIAGFVELKSTLNQLSFSSKAIDEISTTTDSLPALRTTTTTTTTTTSIESLPIIEENTQGKNTRRQQKKRAQELAKELAKLDQDPKVQTETIITTDTSYQQPDTVIGTIQQILVELGAEESKYQEILASKELQLIESSMVIIDQIRALIGELERQELSQNIQRAVNTKMIASRSTLTISVIIFVCLLFGILFTFLIFKDVKIGDYYNKQLIGAKNEAQQLAESKQQFLANMSHEIRTPLNAIVGFTEQLSQTLLKPKQQQYLNAVQSSSKHLLQTVNEILDYSKMEAGAINIVQVPFELGETLREVITALELKAYEKGLKVALKIIPEDPILLMGDPFRLKQVLFNLVNNGIKFTNDGFVNTTCNYSIEKNVVAVTIAVKDSGIGIPPEQQQDIFEDFKQVDTSETRQYEGTGLGLAICKQLITLQNGSISVSSNGEQGSEFVVELKFPLAEKALSATQGAVVVDSPRSLNGIAVLVADDDAFNIQLMKTILEKWETDVHYCSNGKQAFEIIKNHTIDIVLTDIHMPEVGGMELSRLIRSLSDHEKKSVPILALTANVMKPDLERYKEAGIDDFVLKPFEEALLYQKIVELVPSPHKATGNKQRIELSDFRKFSGDDNDALLPILEAFYHNLKENVKRLEIFADKKDMSAIAELAHKMISSFGHVHASEPIGKLRILETRIRKEELEIPVDQLVNEITQLSKPILDDLRREINLLGA